MSRTLGGKPCARCGEPKPPGRAKYCSDECLQASQRERDQARQQARMQKCRICGGEKELGVRGGKYCAECRRLVADASQQMEQERERRRRLKDLEGRLASPRGVRRRSDAPDGQKWCARCQEFRPLSSFPNRKKGGKAAAYCRSCQRSYNREKRLKHIYGLTWDEYELMLACQEDACFICGRRPRKAALAVDHDHKTGEVRGLLCKVCNHRLLGAAQESIEILQRAIDYLKNPPAREVFGDMKFVPGFDGDPL